MANSEQLRQNINQQGYHKFLIAAEIKQQGTNK